MHPLFNVITRNEVVDAMLAMLTPVRGVIEDAIEDVISDSATVGPLVGFSVTGNGQSILGRSVIT